MKYAKFRKTAALFLAAGIAAVSAANALPVRTQASPVSYLPGVTDEMTHPEYWAALQDQRLGAGSSAQLLATAPSIAELNRRTMAQPSCQMTDLAAVPACFDGIAQREALLKGAESDFQYFKSSGAIYDQTGNVAGPEFYAQILANTQDPGALKQQFIKYGICTERTDVRSYPTMQILTDEAGDVDFDYFQNSALRVNEPVVIKGRSADGLWYLVKTICCDGWVRASDIAVCSSKEEWQSAFQIPDDHLIVVTGGKLYLEKSNRNPDIAGKMLTMGTTLRRADSWEYTPAVTNRAAVNNYAVWMPLRAADGTYQKKVVLISQHDPVSAGYLPLTTQNVLNVAFTMLGDAYGWGAMLDSADCSSYIRDIYKCFGIELPRNTTWQASMPAVKCDLSPLPQDASGDPAKKALLDTLPAGSALYFSGHAMMYLGRVGDEYYVISSVSSMADPETGKYLRVRGVVVNSLSAKRLSGKTWLNCINMAVVPYLAAPQ